uniref:DnaJ heat shock protein family (Hsp40) member C24 n=1 Tax=Molossus molossus TaxID=27622 RepID=A0A7J8EPK7_MOLMO|nr:DnaJ heat shock protein family (Hsp40) member C24 [Molossus molossus]
MMAFERIPKKDWYSILGANSSASMADLKQKYQKLILMKIQEEGRFPSSFYEASIILIPKLQRKETAGQYP